MLSYHNHLKNLSLNLAQLHFTFKVILEDLSYFQKSFTENMSPLFPQT